MILCFVVELQFFNLFAVVGGRGKGMLIKKCIFKETSWNFDKSVMAPKSNKSVTEKGG